MFIYNYLKAATFSKMSSTERFLIVSKIFYKVEFTFKRHFAWVSTLRTTELLREFSRKFGTSDALNTYAWFGHTARFLPTPFLTVPTRPRGPVHHVFPEESGDSRSHPSRSYTSIQEEVKSGCGNIGCFTPAICILIRPSVDPDHAILIYSNLASLTRFVWKHSCDAKTSISNCILVDVFT